MRKGKNPAKLQDNIKVEQDCFHQVIIPVYLPDLEGYYKEGLEILQLCVESIYLTSHDKTFISVVNNGSCNAVKEYLNKCLDDGIIQEVIHTSAIGKVNSIAKGLSGHDFDLITITDGDVLFTNGWQNAVYKVYGTFPKAGMVGTTPNALGEKYLNENIYFDNIFKKNIKSESPDSYEDIKLFYESIGRETNNIHNLKIKTLCSDDNFKAVIGSGHYCSTYRKECLYKFGIKETSQLKMGGDIMKEYIDKPIYWLGLWRLTTFKNFTYHLGNVKENWMTKKFKQIEKEHSNPNLLLNKIPLRPSKLLANFKSPFIRKFIYKKDV